MGPWEEEIEDKMKKANGQRQVCVELPNLGNTL